MKHIVAWKRVLVRCRKGDDRALANVGEIKQLARPNNQEPFDVMQ
jgi:hypothetical protein